MRIERIDKNKVIILLKTGELGEYGIDAANVTANSKGVRNFIAMVLDKMRRRTDFDPVCGRLEVRYRPDAGELWLIISRLSDKELRRLEAAKKRGIRGVHIKATVRENGRTKQAHGTGAPRQGKVPAVFVFESFNDMCEGLMRADKRVIGTGALYRSGKSYCFSVRFGSAAEHRKTSAVLREYASCSCGEKLMRHIAEHWQLVAEKDALANMAERITELYGE